MSQSHTNLKAHFGDPCIFCATPHDAVQPGPCPQVATPAEAGAALFRQQGSGWRTWEELTPAYQRNWIKSAASYRTDETETLQK